MIVCKSGDSFIEKLRNGNGFCVSFADGRGKTFDRQIDAFDYFMVNLAE